MISESEGSNFWRYLWNTRTKWRRLSTRKQTLRYKFDALGRRTQRYFVGGKENTKFIYDGQDVLSDDNAGTLTKYQKFLGIDNKLRAPSGLGSQKWLWDLGVQAKLRVLGQRVALSYGKDLRSGNDAFYVAFR